MIRLEKSLLLCALITVFGTAAAKVHSFDIFWQLHSGRYILESGTFIYRDLFTLAADAPRYEHCWLHDLVFYGVYGLGGFTGISLLKGLLVAAAAFLSGMTALRRGSSPLATLAIVPPVFFLTRGGWLERPQLWSFLFFALFLLLLERYRRTPGRTVWVLLPLTAVWTNLHAGYVLVFPLLAAYLAGWGGEALLGRSPLPAGALKRLGLLALLVPLATLVTPYGIEPLKVLFYAPLQGAGSGLVTYLYNMDWIPTTFASFSLFYVVIGLCVLLFLTGWRRLSMTDVLLLGGTALMGMRMQRHTTFFFLATAALLPLYVDAAARFLLRGRSGGRFGKLLRLLCLSLALWGTIVSARPVLREYGFFDTGLRSWHYPISAARFVREQHLPGNLYNTYEWGGYLMWTLFPEYRVFWDGRQNSEEMFRYGLVVQSGLPNWQRILDRFEVRTVVSKACDLSTGERYPLLDRLRESPDWALVHADVSAMVLVRRDAVSPEWLKAFELDRERMDDTILSEARLLVEVDPRRYRAYWEMARIYLARRQYRMAFDALKNYLSRAPAGDEVAERYYRMLLPMAKEWH